MNGQRTMHCVYALQLSSNIRYMITGMTVGSFSSYN